MTNISFFPHHKSKEPSQTLSIDTLLEQIRDGQWKSQVEHLRGENDPEKRKDLKLALPGVTISGTFRVRNREGLIRHSGFICIDVDYEIERDLIEKDPYTYACFDSVSKRGLAIVVKIKPDAHEPSFCFLQKYYFETYGIAIDGAPKSTVSLRCISYDPHLVIRPKSKVSKTYIPKPPKPSNSLPIVLSDEQINEVASEIISRGVDLAPDYESYYLLALSLSRGIGQSGRDLFHRLCSVNEKYKFSQADRKFTDALKAPATTAKSISIGTFFHMAKSAGITLPDTNKKSTSLAAMAKKAGRTQKAVTEQLVSINHVPEPLAERIASEVFAREDITLKTLASDPEHLIESLVQFIKTHYPLRRNEITQKIEHVTSSSQATTPKCLIDEDINDIYLHSRAAFNTPHITKDLIQSIIFSSQTPNYNPITDFIQRHQHITTTGHIDRLISAIKTTTPYANIFIRKWIIAIHAAIEYHPVRLMLTFTGPQYNGKTEFFRRLLPSYLKPFYAESKLDRGKDDELLMCQKLIVMDDEMGGKSKQDEKRLKELTSKEYFTLRAPYRRDNMDYRRLAILCGTSNPTEIMNDPTGNTRILPVQVDSIDYELLNSVDRTDLFIEAYHAYKSGESWSLSQHEVEVLSSLSGDFSNIAFEHELILQFFSPGGPDFLTATEIKNEIETNSKQQIKNMTRFGIELRKILGKPKSVKRNNYTEKRYEVTKVSTSINAINFQESQNEPLPF